MVSRVLASSALVLVGCFPEFGTFESGGGGQSTAGGQSAGGASDIDDPNGGTGGESDGGAIVVGGEACSNGLDDDTDGLTDCGDADCSSFECVNVVGLSEWKGPFLRRDVTDPTPNCPQSFPNKVEGLVAITTPCVCDCGPSTGELCQAAHVAFYGAGCGNAALGDLQVPLNECVDLTLPVGSTAAHVDGAAGGGSCAPFVGGGPSLADKPVALCEGVLGGGCSAGEGCLRPGAPNEGVCFMREGDVACPSPDFQARQLVYEAAGGASPTCNVDACGCSSSAGGVCAPLMNFFDFCGGGKMTIPVDDFCFDLGAGPSGTSLLGGPVTTPGTCAPNSRFPVGALVGSSVATLCCSR